MMPLKVWFFSHVFLTLALGAPNSVVNGWIAAGRRDIEQRLTRNEGCDTKLSRAKVSSDRLYLISVIQFSTNAARSSMSTVPAGTLRSQYVFQ